MGSRRILIGSVSLGLLLVTTSCRAEFGSFGGAGSVGSAVGGNDRDPEGGGPGSGGEGQAGGSAEDCLSGDDEDADGLVDCEDLGDCGGHLCAPLHDDADGWEGPIALHAPGATGCGPGWQLWKEGTELLTNESAVCGCGCGPASGQGCAATVLINCNNESPLVVPVGQCVNMPFTATAFAAATRPVGGSCAPSAQTESPTYEPRLACIAPAGEGCEEGFCTRPPAPGPGAGICFVRSGIHPCVRAPYLSRSVIVDETPGSLACGGECACGAPDGGDCSGAIGLHDAGGCSGAAEATTTETCEQFGASLSFQSFDYPPGATISTAGLCSPTTRAIDADDIVTTFCCASP